MVFVEASLATLLKLQVGIRGAYVTNVSHLGAELIIKTYPCPIKYLIEHITMESGLVHDLRFLN